MMSVRLQLLKGEGRAGVHGMDEALRHPSHSENCLPVSRLFFRIVASLRVAYLVETADFIRRQGDAVGTQFVHAAAEVGAQLAMSV